MSAPLHDPRRPPELPIGSHGGSPADAAEEPGPAWLERLDALAHGPPPARSEEEGARGREEGDRDESFERYRRTVELLGSLERPKAPEGFAASVRRRIRRRQRYQRSLAGARAHPDARPPWEALLNLVLLGALVALWFATIPRADRPPLPVDPRTLSRQSHEAGSSAGIALAILHTYGEVDVVEGSEGPLGITYRLTLPRDHLSTLRRELSLYPFIETRGPPLPAYQREHVEIRVRASPR